MPPGALIDFSTHKAQVKIFNKGPDGYGKWVADNFHHIAKTLGRGEILVEWRGEVPWEYNHVVSDLNAANFGKLGDFIEES